MGNYNPELAWPLILDNFVEWIVEKQTWKILMSLPKSQFQSLKSFTRVSNSFRIQFKLEPSLGLWFTQVSMNWSLFWFGLVRRINGLIKNRLIKFLFQFSSFKNIKTKNTLYDSCYMWLTSIEGTHFVCFIFIKFLLVTKPMSNAKRFWICLDSVY